MEQIETQSVGQRIAWLVGTCFALAATATSVDGADTPAPSLARPTIAYVAVERATLQAGPSDDYYATGLAKRGAVLEVYERSDSGWLAVRPPQGSFSWVPAAQAYLLPGGRTIEITDKAAVSWIGSELGSAKQYRWQVQLQVGEQLNVLGEAKVASDAKVASEALWYKVAPPAGEFRWIKAIATSSTPPAPVPDPETELASHEHSPNVTPEKPTKAKANQTTATSDETVAASSDDSDSSTRDPKVVTASYNRTKRQPAQRSSSGPVRTASAEQLLPDMLAQSPEQQASPWSAWHAMEIGDSGMRFPLMERMVRPAVTDPLAKDPFSLAMPGTPMADATPAEIRQNRRENRGWRDPSTLRDSRFNQSDTPRNSTLELSSRNKDRTNDRASNANYDYSPPDLASPVKPSFGQWYGFHFGSRFSSPPVTPLADASAPALNTLPNRTADRIAATRVGSGGATLGDLRTSSLADLQLELSEQVAGIPQTWNLAPLAERAHYFVEHGADALERGQARLLLDRIAQFQSVAQRSLQLTSATPINVQTASYQANSPATYGNEARAEAQAAHNPQSVYDATGWLVATHAAGADQPTHALTNDTGDVIAYVSGIPGLNLDRYLNQAVGVTGLRGYLPQLQASHLQASHVVRLR